MIDASIDQTRGENPDGSQDQIQSVSRGQIQNANRDLIRGESRDVKEHDFLGKKIMFFIDFDQIVGRWIGFG